MLDSAKENPCGQSKRRTVGGNSQRLQRRCRCSLGGYLVCAAVITSARTAA